MQRPLVIYAAAAATLVGAFLLVPKFSEAPPEPPPPTPAEPTPDAQPITRLSYADGTVSVDARLERGYVTGIGTAEPVWMDVRIKATDNANRAQLSSVLVIDRSGSMAGDKIDRARTAARHFVKRLQDGDQLAIVTYGTDVSVDMPLTRVDGQSRARALRLISEVEEGGGTNIDGALRAARRALENAGSVTGVSRVVLISDGRPTEGDRRIDRLARHATALRDAGATLSTIGIGLDYNDDLMERLATDGSGRYHYLRRGSELAAILDDELKHATAVVARALNLHLQKGSAYSIGAAPGVTLEARGNVTVLHVGDLAAGEERRVLVRLDPRAAKVFATEGAFIELGAPEVTYSPADGGSKRLLAHRADPFRVVVTHDATRSASSVSDDVRIRVLEVESAVALTESMNAYKKGDVARAKDVLEQNRSRLERVGKRTKSKKLMEQAKGLGRVLKKVTSSPKPSSAGAQDMIKYEKARAFDLRR